VTSTLEFAGDLAAPVVIVTPFGIGVGGREERRGRTRFVGAGRGRALAGDVTVPAGADGDAMARAAMTTVRRIARAGGHPLPAEVPPAHLVVSRTPASGDESPRPAGDGSVALWIPLAALAALITLGAGLIRRRRVSVR
jgi:hypothetical protein